MAERSQLNEERIESLIELLVSKGVISREEGTTLEATSDYGQADEAAQAFREGRGPPEWSPGHSEEKDGQR